MSKNKSKVRICFTGMNACEVTGSQTLITTPERKILLECGLFQSNNVKEDYKINSRRPEFKPSELDYIFIGHGHIDHIGLLPRLYANGCTAKVIVPKGTASMFTIMGADSAFISGKDAEFLQRKFGMNVEPLYSQEDVKVALQYFEEYDFGETIKLDEYISFRFTPSGHIVNSAQTELWITNGNHTSKILYTSDLGNISVPKFYSGAFQSVEKANIVIAESTYSDRKNEITKETRIKDLEKLKAVIENTCVFDKRRVLIPVFSLDRAQNILTHLYNLFGNDVSFKTPILIDSPLTVKLSKLYPSLLKGEELDRYNDVLNWENVKLISEYEDSTIWQNSKEPCVILSSSGMMQAGRSRQWAKMLLPDSKNHILFVGYSPDGSLASKIKKGNEQKTITIDGKAIPNKCQITNLQSFSSHIQYSDMLKYYSDINTEKICLVHGDFESKCKFAKTLQKEISKKNKTSRVIAVNKNTEITL